ncbi:hypothetical protein [Paraburkholderia phytofirmans]|uniref:hypothetical protein n=1 Tax=Paraburkholderia phytofirmans TaxID=261302 RepID=UPI0011DFD21B|nr:hypothetical protein [Paraburkholderia phytofirmans]
MTLSVQAQTGATRIGAPVHPRNKQQATSNKQQATSNKQQATSNKQQASAHLAAREGGEHFTHEAAHRTRLMNNMRWTHSACR